MGDRAAVEDLRPATAAATAALLRRWITVLGCVGIRDETTAQVMKCCLQEDNEERLFFFFFGSSDSGRGAEYMLRLRYACCTAASALP